MGHIYFNEWLQEARLLVVPLFLDFINFLLAQLMQTPWSQKSKVVELLL